MHKTNYAQENVVFHSNSNIIELTIANIFTNL